MLTPTETWIVFIHMNTLRTSSKTDLQAYDGLAHVQQDLQAPALETLFQLQVEQGRLPDDPLA